MGMIAAIILVVLIIIAQIANKNVKAMNSCIDAVLNELNAHYTVTPRDVGQYCEMKLFGLMKFDVDQYDIEELGNLSVMRVNMGVMQMATAVITPRDKNMPLLSADYMYILPCHFPPFSVPLPQPQSSLSAAADSYEGSQGNRVWEKRLCFSR